MSKRRVQHIGIENVEFECLIDKIKQSEVHRAISLKNKSRISNAL
jgi:hypothetical protein